MSAFRRIDTGGGPLRVVQVGAGAMGRAWLQAVAVSEEVELVGVVDLDLDAASAGARVAGVPDLPVGTDLVDLAARTGAHAVLDVTVPAAHHPVTVRALTAGLPVLGEKPAAKDVAETLSLVAASEATGELFLVSQSRRRDDRLVEFGSHLDRLGRVGMLSTSFARAPRFGGFRDEMDDVLLLDMAIHPFDSARYLLRDEPVAVTCRSWNPAWSWYRGDAAASALFEFAGGGVYSYDGSWCSPGFETSWNGTWRGSGERGTALWSGDDVPVLDIVGDGVEIVARPGLGDGIAGSLAAFASALRTGETPDGEVHGNVLSLAMVEAAIVSTRGTRRVELDEVLAAAHALALARETSAASAARLRAWPSVREALADVGALV